MSKEIEHYIEHEVKLRIHDEKFTRIESKLNWLITLVVSGILIPILLHYLKLV
jgi:hypothetical protein